MDVKFKIDRKHLRLRIRNVEPYILYLSVQISLLQGVTMDLNTAVGHTLQRIRQENLLTLRQVSAKCYVSLGHLSDIETSKTPVSLPMLEQVCTKGLGIEMTVLMKEIYDTLKENK
jgi:hypothetical protein